MSNPLDAIYNELSEAASALEKSEKKQTFGCPPGCGICCQGFDPDITQVELTHTARWLSERPEFDSLVFADRFPDEKTCRFFRPDTPFHCAIYPGRPLVCRTFGYTAVRDKTGTPVFTYCRHMPTDGKRTLRGNEIAEALGLMPPLAEDAGVQVASLGSEERVSLSNSIGRAVAYQRYLRTLENEDPDPNEPVPPQVPPKAA